MDLISIIDPILNVVGPLVEGFAVQYPIIALILFFIGAFRFFMKPAMIAVEAWIAKTKTKSDDIWLSNLKENKIYKVVVFLLDWVLSVKLPK